MRGSIGIRTTILLVIGIMVIGVALWFLTFVVNFDALFLSNDQLTLKQYATCSLAYCAAGAGSDEVNAVGCLKRENGECVLSCAQVEEKIYEANNIQPTVFEVGGRGAPHYCGEEAKLSFEFSDLNFGGRVQLASGQMDRLANKPEWVCKPIKIPFLGAELDSLGIPTVDIQHGGAGFLPQNCIILSGKDSPIFPGREGCFLPIEYDESKDDYYHTPLMQYDESQQIIYPSAIYVDRSFTTVLKGESEPECEYRTAPQVLGSKEEVIGKVNELSRVEVGDGSEKQDDAKFEQKLLGNELTRCNFEVRHDNEKITYHVWSKPVYPTLDVLKEASGIEGFQNFVASMLGVLSKDLKNGFIETTGIGEEGTRLVFSQLGGSCTSVVLTRNLEDDATTDQEVIVSTKESLVLQTDREIYSGGDVVAISGNIDLENAKTQSLPSKGRKTKHNVKITITKDFEIFGTTTIDTERIAPDNEGNFAWEFQLNEDTASGPYKIIAAYGLEEKEIEFTVE